jgi:hypothetical protein
MVKNAWTKILLLLELKQTEFKCGGKSQHKIGVLHINYAYLHTRLIDNIKTTKH